MESELDIALFTELQADQPKFNQRLVEGLAVSEMQYAERYVHERIFKPAAAELPPSIQYLGPQRCTPEEEVAETINRQKRAFKKTTFEIAPSDFYMVKYNFSFEGEPMEPLYLMLPSVREAGRLRIRGSMFHITPALADRAISVGMDSIFMPFNKLKVNLFRSQYYYNLDGQREPAYMVYGKLHNAQIKSRGRGRSLLTNVKTVMQHYLFARFGLKEAFQMYCNAEIEVGNPDQITPERYPPSDWVICSTSHVMQQVKGARQLPGTHVKMAVRRQEGAANGITSDTSLFVGAFFYVADHFPHRIDPEYVDDPRLWVVLLGHLLFGSTLSEGKLAEEVYSHLRSLDSAMDQESQANLRLADIYCNNLYDFIANMAVTFSSRVTQAIKTVPSMYGKRLMILRYVFSDLRAGVNRFMWQMNKDATNRKRPLQKKDVINAMRRYIKLDVVYKISGSQHGYVVSVSCPGDNMLLKLTSQVTPQTETSGPRSRTGQGGGRANVDASKLLHVSVAEHGSYITMSKSEPSGRNKLNPYGLFDNDGVLIPNPELAPLLEPIQEMIQR